MNMASFVTVNGQAVINKLLATQGPLHFTRAELGDGVAASEEAARERESLIHKTADAVLTRIAYEGGQATVEIQYNNSLLVTGFNVNEIALYCQDPDDEDKEVLYDYATFGETPDWIAPAALATYVRTYKLGVVVSDVTPITINVSPGAMVTREEFDEFLREYRQNAMLKADPFKYKNLVAFDVNGNALDSGIPLSAIYVDPVAALLGNVYLGEAYLASIMP